MEGVERVVMRKLVLLCLMASSVAMRMCQRRVLVWPVQRPMMVGLSPQKRVLQGELQRSARFVMMSFASCIASEAACPSAAVLSVTSGNARLRLAISILSPLLSAGPETMAAIQAALRSSCVETDPSK